MSQQIKNSTGSIVAGAFYTFNARGFVTELANRKADNIILSDFASMVYDGVGKLTSVTASLPAATAYGGLTSYTYDSNNQLTQESSARSGSYTNSFAYDSAGNPTTFKGTANFFNADNQNTAAGYVYDGNGNPTTYKGTAFSYDAENRVTAIGSLLTAGYRADGLRAWKQNGSGVRTYFLYDGATPVCELNSTGTVIAVNTFGPNGLISRNSGGSSVFYTFDPQGNVAQRLNGSATVLGSYMFDAYGTRGSTDNSSDPFSGYGGQWGYYTDWETGLQLLGHRYYDAATGRFVNRDPIGYTGGINLYTYTGNSPLNGVDPTGHCPPGETQEECDQDQQSGNDQPDGPGNDPGMHQGQPSSGGSFGAPPRYDEAPCDLYSVGPRKGNGSTPPTPPRIGKDVPQADPQTGKIPVDPDEPFPGGKSSNSSIGNLGGLHGPVFRLPEGTNVGPGFYIIPDGPEYNGPHGEGHHSIVPRYPMTPDEMRRLWDQIPWEFTGSYLT